MGHWTRLRYLSLTLIVMSLVSPVRAVEGDDQREGKRRSTTASADDHRPTKRMRMTPAHAGHHHPMINETYCAFYLPTAHPQNYASFIAEKTPQHIRITRIMKTSPRQLALTLFSMGGCSSPRTLNCSPGDKHGLGPILITHQVTPLLPSKGGS